MKRKKLLMLALLLAACAPESGSPPPPGFGWVSDTWLATVEVPRVVIERRVEISANLAPLLRGSPALAPASLDAALMGGGAAEAQCRILDDLPSLAISCLYQHRLPKPAASGLRRLPLPDDALLGFLAELPVESAQGMHIRTRGRAAIPGVFAALPASKQQSGQTGSFVLRRYSLTSLSELLYEGEVRLPPGELPPTLDIQPVSAGFLPRYLPGAASWLALGFALVAALFAVTLVFPVRARLPLEPAMWHPDLRRIPRLLHWLAILLARLIHWIRTSWPRLLNSLLGTTLVGTGGLALAGAWNLARLDGDLTELQWTLNQLLAGLPLPIPTEALLWPGWPIALALLGAGAAVVGIGLLARRQVARLLMAGLVVALLGGHILLWPRLLLAPLLAPFQLELALGLGTSLLLTLAVLARALTHPQYRRYYGDMP